MRMEDGRICSSVWNFGSHWGIPHKDALYKKGICGSAGKAAKAESEQNGIELSL